MQKVKLMAPAGSFESLQAAIRAGCDSIYFGASHLNMRARSSNNFCLDDLAKIADICKKANIKSYLTLNTIMYDSDLNQMRDVIDAAKKFGLDAIIASDFAVINYAHEIGMPLHISTQANVCNIEAVTFYSKFADVIVLARELTLKQITNICKEIEEKNICGPNGKKLKIEIFAHGALCVSISGKCYMSLAGHLASANRGLCLQPCRRRYRVIDEESENELVIDNQYIMSPKDLCTIKFLDQIVSSGISVLKIEGRGRSPDYVYTVTKTYREALENINSFSQEKAEELVKKLETVYNRGFWHGGYYLGKRLGEWSAAYGSKATKQKTYVGKATKYYSKLKVAEFKLESDSIELGDQILITGHTTGVLEGKIESLHTDKATDRAKKGELCTFPVPEKVRKNDKLYLIHDRRD